MSVDDKFDRRLRFLVWASCVVAVLIVGGAIISYPSILRSASNTDALNRSTEISGCRAGYRSLIDDAEAQLNIARADLELANNEGLVAAVLNDDATLADVTGRSPALRTEIERRQQDLDQANDTYQQLVQLSRTDVDAFLVGCSEDQGGAQR